MRREKKKKKEVRVFPLSLQSSNSFDAETFLQLNNLPADTALCIIGTNAADTITGGNGKDIIFGLDGKQSNGHSLSVIDDPKLS